MVWLLDLDGVVWLGDTAIPGAAGAVSRLRADGNRVVFLTNNSAHSVADYVARLNKMGITVNRGDVLTSAEAATSLLEPGSTALVFAGAGVEESLARRGVRAVRSGRADTVVVGFHREFDFTGLSAAVSAVLGGARLIATNDDATYPTPHGPLPGAGSLLAAVAYASGATPTVAGKPNDPTVSLLRQRFGAVDVVVGDRPSTDGKLARRLGARFALVLSGVTDPNHGRLDPAPDTEGADLAALVTDELSGAGSGAEQGSVAARGRAGQQFPSMGGD
jgi:HAD superfamily hydrolase (TIGR01450 family)